MSKNNAIRVAGLGRAVSAILLVTVIISFVLTTTSCSKKFDYFKTDLSEYIEFTEDYKNFKLEVDIAKPHDIDVDVSILNMLYSDRAEKPLYNGGTVTSPITITSGDVVNIWYRGYLIGDDGEQIEVSGMSNFGGNEAYALSIGSNGFIPGFELNMIGKNTGDYSKFNKITSGEISEDYVLYISYSRTKNEDSSTKTTVTNERVVLTDDIDATYGQGIKEKLLSLKIGDKVDIKAVTEDASYTYTDLRISFATDCEDNPMKIECYFPYDYSKEDLRNETAYFEVYVDGVVVYDCPEFTDEYLKEKIEKEELNLTLEELNEYEGSSLVEKYRNFATESMNEIYEETYISMVADAFWTKLNGISKAKKYPDKEVQKIYDDFVADYSAQFISNGGQVYNSMTGQSKTYDTFDAYIAAYLGLGSAVKWQDFLYAQSEITIKERMAVYHIAKTENLVLSDEEFEKAYDQVFNEFLDEAVSQYLYYSGLDEDEMTEQEREEMLEECRDMVNSNFDEDFLTLRVYYNILQDVIIEWSEVSTLDDRRAYPQDK